MESNKKNELYVILNKKSKEKQKQEKEIFLKYAKEKIEQNRRLVKKGE